MTFCDPSNMSVIEENDLYSDDDDIIAGLLRNEWSLPQNWTPMITTDREMTNAAPDVGYIFVYPVSFYASVSSTDYSCAQVTSYVALRISSRHKNWIKMITRETERIILSNRRASHKLHNYTWLEMVDRMQDNSSIGWYSATLNLKLVNYAKPYNTSGFGCD